MKSLLKITPFVFLLLSCGGSKIEKLLKSGQVDQENFKVTVPFEYRQGLIILKVDIKNKTYDFILDTGASNVVSTELGEELNLEPIDSQLVYGVHGASKKLDYTAIKAIKIGGINFSNTIAVIHDLNAVSKLACLNIHGIIGANLMRQSIWDFDFNNQLITITNTEESLDIPPNYKEVKFFIGYQGAPSIITKANGMRVLNTMIDTGYNGNISLSRIEFQKLIKRKKLTQYNTGNGITGTGVYGAGKKEVFHQGLIDEMSFGDLTLDTTIVSFSGTSHKLIGVEFLKNYRVIFNWNTKKIKFIEITSYKNTKINSYGFDYSFKENQLYIKSVINTSSADTNGLQLGDQIIAINNIDYSTITQNEWCRILKNGLINNSEKKITMTIVRDTKTHELTLNKTVVLK
ncbi:aspartyl protease family protein [Aquimarina longa]|uniref:aspartyl protease family protein n=1 Tax=Aquimarina longa TaxID=1080221 RepID=UPI000AF6D88E|nr:aspartyl protease family protein [Aquimarina longa]